MGKIYFYKGFKFCKSKNPLFNTYIIGNEKEGQIAPNDNIAPQTIRECKEAINSWLKN